MKVVCVTNKVISYDGRIDEYSDITSEKIYEVLDETEDFFWIKNDTGSESWYLKDMFVSLEEWREKQINSVL